MNRTGSCTRKTKETDITVSICLDREKTIYRRVSPFSTTCWTGSRATGYLT